MRNGEDGARDVHCVCAFGDVDDAALLCWGEGMEGMFDGGEGAGVGHWLRVRGCFCSGGGDVLLS